MSTNDWIGTVGVFLILAAYFSNLFQMIEKEGRLFFILNIAGAALACYASWLINYWPFVLLEAIWCIISIVGMIKYNGIKK
jgi:hypothetical protein